MNINISNFNLVNVLDTCSIWNILSSKVILHSALQKNVHFSMTQFVEYECLRKPRSKSTRSDLELKSRLEKAISDGHFKVFALSISDLQHLDVLERRKRLGRGELSTIVFARKIYQSIITDDQAARKFAQEILGSEMVQTTPHLVGWMFYHGVLIDSSLQEIISEHNGFSRPLERFFHQVYMSAMEWKLKANAHPQ